MLPVPCTARVGNVDARTSEYLLLLARTYDDRVHPDEANYSGRRTVEKIQIG
jgi:hypothetical protein